MMHLSVDSTKAGGLFPTLDMLSKRWGVAVEIKQIDGHQVKVVVHPWYEGASGLIPGQRYLKLDRNVQKYYKCVGYKEYSAVVEQKKEPAKLQAIVE